MRSDEQLELVQGLRECVAAVRDHLQEAACGTGQDASQWEAPSRSEQALIAVIDRLVTRYLYLVAEARSTTGAAEEDGADESAPRMPTRLCDKQSVDT